MFCYYLTEQKTRQQPNKVNVSSCIHFVDSLSSKHKTWPSGGVNRIMGAFGRERDPRETWFRVYLLLPSPGPLQNNQRTSDRRLKGVYENVNLWNARGKKDKSSFLLFLFVFLIGSMAMSEWNIWSGLAIPSTTTKSGKMFHHSSPFYVFHYFLYSKLWTRKQSESTDKKVQFYIFIVSRQLGVVFFTERNTTRVSIRSLAV